MANLLIIDDDHQITLAEDGAKGLKNIQENIPDIIKEELETIREIKRDYPGMKIIVIAGGGNPDVKSYFKIAQIFGADASLVKPFMASDLINQSNFQEYIQPGFDIFCQA